MGIPVTIDNYRIRVEEEIKQYAKNHADWAKTFMEAEKNRREDEKEWRKFYKEVYEEENATWKKYVIFALNAIQMWALYTQYKQQKEIANRTYELANRQLKLAEEMFAFYKSTYQPHETAMAKQIDGYFANPYRPQYKITSGRFALNARMQMIGKRREVLMCASEYCTGATRTTLRDLAIQEATLVGNALNSGIKYENLREQKMEDKWLQVRVAFIGNGRGVSAQGLGGIDQAVNAFHTFGADPGAALSQLLGTIAKTVGGIIPQPNFASGNNTVYNSSRPINAGVHRPVTKVQVSH